MHVFACLYQPGVEHSSNACLGRSRMRQFIGHTHVTEVGKGTKLLPGKALLAIKTTPNLCGFCILAPCQLSIVASQIGTRTWEGGKMNRNQFSLLFDELTGHREPNLNLGCKFWAGGDKEVIRWALLEIELFWKLNVSSHLWQIIDRDGSLSASPGPWQA